MKNKVQCSNGHFYNADIYNECPVCGETKRKEKDSLSNDIYGAMAAQNKEEGLKSISQSGSIYIENKNNIDSMKTEAVFDVDEEVKEAIIEEEKKNVKVKNQKRKSQPKLKSLSSDNNFDIDDDSKTMAIWDDKDGVMVSPVCGWLVCIKGEHQGDSFRIEAGNNNIGRDQDMNIAIRNEKSISRKKHAVITYDAKGNNFYLNQGESSGIIYINDEIVLEANKLKGGEKIGIGNAEFLFIPLCGEGFNWEKILKNE